MNNNDFVMINVLKKRFNEELKYQKTVKYTKKSPEINYR